MSLKAEIDTWVRALNAYDEQDYDTAISTFLTISDSARILTNIGLIYAVMGEHVKAVDSFNTAVTLDRYLAVAYFQCGVSNFLIGRLELALRDFDSAIENLRGNDCIKYSQLGLDFTLYAAELLFNRGLCQINLGFIEEGLEDLRLAVRAKAAPEHEVIDECLAAQGEGFTVFSIPIGVLFRPPQMKVKNLKQRDYLGTALLVATDDARNAFTGFHGTERLKRGEGPAGQRVQAPIVDDQRPAAALVDIPRPRDEWIPGQALTRSISAGGGSIARSTSTLRRNRSAGNPVAPAPPPPLARGMSIARGTFPMVRSPDAGRAPQLPLQSPPGPLAAIYDTYIDGSEQQTAASRAQPSSGLGLSRAPSLASGPVRRPTNARRTPVMRSRFTDTSYDDDEAYASAEDAGVTPTFIRIRVKMHWRDEVRGMAIPPDMPYAVFADRVKGKFGTATAPSMKFADEDGAKVSLIDEMDYDLAIETARESTKGREQDGRLEIWCSTD
ncbi:hypothetical protein EXIGLDRAFT_756355 [Exidia glandulosa HHB12029]|uniref:PB1 domain-containing protein n=1 Tax=Exidia glandulosa HHB12029 TaxID=1314781 RepID=A0A165BBV2_EXIGL|nr:hypothetical protein EXIGLDRAFT_756355 [Exidia glandulosa HHB12029]